MSIKKLSTEFANEFSALVSRTVAMMQAAAVLALDSGDFVSAVSVLPTYAHKVTMHSANVNK